MSEEGDMWRAVRSAKDKKKQYNKEYSTQLLQGAGITFDSRNDGTHLIVFADDVTVIDYWPSTGLWIVRGVDKKDRGVRKLIQYVAAVQNA